MSFSPVLTEVLWNRLLAIVEEEASTLMRTGFTSLISDAGDISAGVFDQRGRMVAQAVTGSPGHINSMATGVVHFLSCFPPEELSPGDVLIGNDPHLFSGHKHDFTVVTPVWRDGRPIAYFANTCHALDVGGRGLGTSASDVYEEGIAVPMSKLHVAGQPNELLLAVIRENVRTPYEVLGDLSAQVVANEVVADRLLQTMDKFGLNNIETLSDEIVARTRDAMREAIGEVPTGLYHGEIFSDGMDEPIALRCSIEVTPDRQLIVDYAGTSAQSLRGINVVLNYTRAMTTFALKSILAPEIPNNAGSLGVIETKAPEGSILNARHPAPVAARHIVGHFIPECLFGALYEAIPDRVIAQGSILWIIHLNGQWEDGRPFTSVVFTCGGMGASRYRDGLSATAFPTGIRGTPVEVVEATSPVFFRYKELCPDSGGAGRYRGGLGQSMRLGVRTKETYHFPTMYDRSRFPNLGLEGGLAGGRSEILLEDGTELHPKSHYRLEADREIVMHTPGGGGYGSPQERPIASVAADVEAGYVGAEAAANEYGVVVDPATLEVDRERSVLLREGSSPRPYRDRDERRGPTSADESEAE